MPNKCLRIATEEAFITAEIMDAWHKLLSTDQVEPGFAKMGETILGTGPGTELIHRRLLDLGPGRIAQMDEDGVDFAILSLTSPGVQVFEPKVASALAAAANDLLADAISNYPDRFGGLAAVAPNDPHGAARELERAKALGMSGAIINSHTAGEFLDLAKFAPLLEAAEALDLPIYLHPREPPPQMIAPYLDYGLYFAGWGFAAESGLHAMRLIMSGVFERFPRLIVILGHLGEGIPFWLERIDNRYRLQVKIGAVTPLPELPSFYFRRNFRITTGGFSSVAALRLAVETVGVENVMFACDYPYEDAAAAVQFIETAPLSHSEREAIYTTNAIREFKLTVR